MTDLQIEAHTAAGELSQVHMRTLGETTTSEAHAFVVADRVLRALAAGAILCKPEPFGYGWHEVFEGRVSCVNIDAKHSPGHNVPLYESIEVK